MVFRLARTQIVLIFFVTLHFSCVRGIQPVIRESAPTLVVEGMISTDSAPYNVKLTFTGQLLNASAHIDSNQNYINDASVLIRDDQGDSCPFQLVSPGLYQSTNSNFLGAVGRTYVLEIHLANGETYKSSPEQIPPVPPIDSFSVVYDSTYITDVRPTQIIVSANVHDPEKTTNFYRWTSFGYVPRKSWGGPCTIGSPPCTDPYMCTCFALCVQYHPDNALNILSDQFVNGREIIQPVYYSPVYWFGRHFVEVKQMSLNRDLYIFWQQYLEQTARTGSILDPLPASLTGNIRNVADSNDVALGYFQVSAVTTRKIIIVPYFLQEYLLASVAGSYIPPGDCHAEIPNSLGDDQDPPGWEDAEIIQMH
ncbi:MAG TPA: DUF4249 domain-containing protein [Puia sp.]|nr:DUF4249 domain-containing protein [Puia sp.]